MKRKTNFDHSLSMIEETSGKKQCKNRFGHQKQMKNEMKSVTVVFEYQTNPTISNQIS